jgi:hypothetical protein
MKLSSNVYIPRKPNSRDRDILDSICLFLSVTVPRPLFMNKQPKCLPQTPGIQLVRQLWQLTPETIRVKGFALALEGVPLSTIGP